jgi:hypothetical protein
MRHDPLMRSFVLPPRARRSASEPSVFPVGPEHQARLSFASRSLALAILLTACSDGPADDDAGATVLDSGAMTDAGKDDAGSDPEPDAGDPDDAGNTSCGCIDETLRWELEGGLVAFRAIQEVTACRTFTYTREPRGGAPMTCSNELPCQGDLTTIDALEDALAHPDVVAAFAAAPVLYGRDERALDGPLLVITYAGDAVSVGYPCEGAADCTEIPPGIAALDDLLGALASERLEEEPCASMF